MQQFEFGDENALVHFAADFARALKIGDCITLEGDLGVGKTTLARAVIRSLATDFDGLIDVPSPTFTLVQHYETIPPATHMDLYRISDPEELDELGLGEALSNGIALIEWPSKAQGNLPSQLIKITISETADPDQRVMKIEASDEFQSRLSRSLEIREFLQVSHMGHTHRLPFSGDASARAYELIETGVPSALPLILMDAPRAADGPPIYDGLPYSQVVHLAEDVSAFVAISNLLRSQGFAAPEILAHNMPAGLLLIENLGPGKIVDDENIPIAERYLVASELLAELHGKSWPDNYQLPDGATHKIPRYDERAMRIGLSLLPDWWGKENGLSSAEAEQLYQLWAPIFERLQTGYDDLIIRDYHSPNIIWRQSEQGSNRIGIIDHQDAMIGPGLYDLASLMQDARTVVPLDLQHQIMDVYCAIRNNDGGFDEAQARLDVATLCAFRNSRLLGLWVRLDLRDNKPRFRQYVKQTKVYLAQALAHEGLAELRDWYLKAGIIDG